MKCKDGYEANSALCAVCSSGYYKQLRSCVECKSVRLLPLVAAVVGLVVLLVIITCVYHKYKRYFRGLLPVLKIVVSFVTVAITIETQFGVRWPTIFLEALSIFSAFSFDLGILSGVFCLMKVSYFQNLLFSTLVLVVGALVVQSLVEVIWMQSNGQVYLEQDAG